MKIKRLRHVGFPVQNLQPAQKILESAGFVAVERGTEMIGDSRISWVKMDNGRGVVIEILDGGHPHIALEVDEVEPSAYYFVAPSGCKIQYTSIPLPLEMVEVPKEEE